MLCGCRCAMISANCMASTSHQSLPLTKGKALANSNFLCPSNRRPHRSDPRSSILQTPPRPQATPTSRRLVHRLLPLSVPLASLLFPSRQRGGAPGIRPAIPPLCCWNSLGGLVFPYLAPAVRSCVNPPYRRHLTLQTAVQPFSHNGLTNDGTPSSDRVEFPGRIGFAFGSWPPIFPGRPARPPHQVCRLHPGTLFRSVIVTP